MTYLLDTNTCVEYLRRGVRSNVTARLDNAAPGSVALCSVVVAELLYGAHRSNQVARNLAQVRLFCARFTSHPFDDRAAEEYGTIRYHLFGMGATIGPNDS